MNVVNVNGAVDRRLPTALIATRYIETIWPYFEVKNYLPLSLTYHYRTWIISWIASILLNDLSCYGIWTIEIVTKIVSKHSLHCYLCIIVLVSVISFLNSSLFSKIKIQSFQQSVLILLTCVRSHLGSTV